MKEIGNLDEFCRSGRLYSVDALSSRLNFM